MFSTQQPCTVLEGHANEPKVHEKRVYRQKLCESREELEWRPKHFKGIQNTPKM